MSGVLFLDLQTLREKRSPTEKMMLKRVKMEVEKRAKIRMIRNLALQNDLEPQNQVADQWVWEISPCVLFLAGVVSWQHKLHLFSVELSVVPHLEVPLLILLLSSCRKSRN